MGDDDPFDSLFPDDDIDNPEAVQEMELVLSQYERELSATNKHQNAADIRPDSALKMQPPAQSTSSPFQLSQLHPSTAHHPQKSVYQQAPSQMMATQSAPMNDLIALRRENAQLKMERMKKEGEVALVREKLAQAEHENTQLKQNMALAESAQKHQETQAQRSFQNEIERLKTQLLFKERELDELRGSRATGSRPTAVQNPSPYGDGFSLSKVQTKSPPDVRETSTQVDIVPGTPPQPTRSALPPTPSSDKKRKIPAISSQICSYLFVADNSEQLRAIRAQIVDTIFQLDYDDSEQNLDSLFDLVAKWIDTSILLGNVAALRVVPSVLKGLFTSISVPTHFSDIVLQKYVNAVNSSIAFLKQRQNEASDYREIFHGIVRPIAYIQSSPITMGPLVTKLFKETLFHKKNDPAFFLIFTEIRYHFLDADQVLFLLNEPGASGSANQDKAMIHYLLDIWFCDTIAAKDRMKLHKLLHAILNVYRNNHQIVQGVLEKCLPAALRLINQSISEFFAWPKIENVDELLHQTIQLVHHMSFCVSPDEWRQFIMTTTCVPYMTVPRGPTVSLYGFYYRTLTSYLSLRDACDVVKPDDEKLVNHLLVLISTTKDTSVPNIVS